MRSALMAFFLLALLTFCGCLALPQTFRDADPGAQLGSADTGPGSGGRIDALELQSLVMGMADDYASEIAEIVYLLLKPVATSQGELALAQSYMRNSFGAAAEIAAGPNPEVALLDLLVLVSLQRATFERHWIPQVWGEERGGPSLARLRKVEARLWGRSEVLLSVEQRATLRSLVEAWLRDNPDRLVVELVRFQEFADARHLASLEDRVAASGLLREVGQAVRVIDDARLYGERALWYSGRLIYILGEQMELTAYRIFANPRIETALADIDALRESFQRAAETFEALPELLRTQEAEFLAGLGVERKAAIKQLGDTLQANVMVALNELVRQIKAEREDAINQFFTRFQDEREQLLTALEIESDRLRGLLSEMRETIVASTELVRLTGESATTIDRIVARFDEPSPTDGDRVDGLVESRALVADVSEAADRLTTLLERANGLLESPRWNERLGAVDGLAADVVDRIFWRLAVLVAVVFVSILVLRYLPRR